MQNAFKYYLCILGIRVDLSLNELFKESNALDAVEV